MTDDAPPLNWYLWNIIRRAKAAELIISLSDGQEKYTSQAMKLMGGSNGTVTQRINELEENGILVSTRAAKWPYRRTLKLTPRGWHIAKALRGVLNV